MSQATSVRPAPGAPRPYLFPTFERQSLPNGLTVWLIPLPDRELTSVHLLLDAGASAEDEPHAGVAALTAQLLVTGTRDLDASEFAETTERLGIEMSSESSWDFARAAFQALPRFLDDGLSLLADMLRDPRLDRGEFERLKTERLTDILQARADPGRLADERFLHHLYDEGTPYHRLSAGTPETVGQLTLDDVKAHHAAHYLPGRAHLIVAGAFDREAVMRAAGQRLGDWSGSGAGHREIAPRAAGGRRIVLVDRPSSVQSELRVGRIGISRSDPRYFHAVVMSAVLGGVFWSRLNVRLREELGYTYSAHSSLDIRRFPGPFTARTAVQTEVTAPALIELLAQLDGMRTAETPEKELREVKDYLIGVFPLRFESTGGVAAAIEPLAIYGLADDYWQTYRSNLESVSASDVHQVADELIVTDELLCLVVGDAAKVREELEATGVGPMEVVSPELVLHLDTVPSRNAAGVKSR
jgi:zinc protease